MHAKVSDARRRIPARNFRGTENTDAPAEDCRTLTPERRKRPHQPTTETFNLAAHVLAITQKNFVIGFS